MTNEEIKKEVLHRVAVQKKKRQRILRVSASLGAVVLVSLASVSLMRGGVFDQTPPVSDKVAKPTTTETTAPTEQDVTTTTTTTVDTPATNTTTDGGVVVPTTTVTTVAPTATAKPTTGTDPSQTSQTQTSITTVTTQTTQTTQATKPTYNILWSDSCQGVADESSIWVTYGVGMLCHNCIEKPLQDAQHTDKIAVLAQMCIDGSFVYEGKTYDEYYQQYRDELRIFDGLGTLLKMGDDLKYGEALYTTGTPSGKKWYQSFYEQMVSYIGEDLIAKYIVDGEFLREEAQAARDNFRTETNMEEVQKACEEYASTELIKLLEQLNIAYEVQSGAKNIVFLATAEELTDLSSHQIAGYRFHWAMNRYHIFDE